MWGGLYNDNNYIFTLCTSRRAFLLLHRFPPGRIADPMKCGSDCKHSGMNDINSKIRKWHILNINI